MLGLMEKNLLKVFQIHSVGRSLCDLVKILRHVRK